MGRRHCTTVTRCAGRTAQPDVAHVIEEGLLHGRAEAGGVGEPVVHLQVDIHVVVTRPRGVLLRNPAAGEVGGKGVASRGGDEEVAAVVEEERFYKGISLRTVVGIDERRGLRIARVGKVGKREIECVEERRVVCHVSCKEIRERLLRRLGCRLLDLRTRVNTKEGVVGSSVAFGLVVIGAGSDDQGQARLVGRRDFHGSIGARRVWSACHAYDTVKLHTGGSQHA